MRPNSSTIYLNDEQAKQLSDLLDARKEFFVSGWGCYLHTSGG